MKCLCCRTQERRDKQLVCPDCWDLVPHEIKRSCYGGTRASRLAGCREALKAAKVAFATMQPVLLRHDSANLGSPLD